MLAVKSILAFGLAAGVLVLAAPVAAQIVHFDLREMNGSGARATATVTSNPDGSLSVTLTGTGFTPNSPHAQHIHGSVKSRRFFCPPASADKDGDGQVATEEGVQQYGGIRLALTTGGDVSPDSRWAMDRMPVADRSGFLGYSRRIPAGQVPAGLWENLENLHIVQHGLDVNGNGKYDREEATNPATCGEVTPVGSVETGSGAPPEGVDDVSLFLVLGAAGLAGAAGVLMLLRLLPHSSRGA